MLITCGLWYIVSSLCHLHTNQRKESAQRHTDSSYEQNLLVEEMFSLVED